MCGTKCIVDIDVSQTGKLLREGLFVFGFFFSEADIFQQDDIARMHCEGQCLCIFADHFLVLRQLDRLTEQLAQSGSDRSQREFFLVFTLRSAQVGAEDDLCLMVDQVLDGWQSSHDALVVGNHAVLERNVKVAAHQHTFAGYINIFDCLFVQRIHHR